MALRLTLIALVTFANAYANARTEPALRRGSQGHRERPPHDPGLVAGGHCCALAHSAALCTAAVFRAGVLCARVVCCRDTVRVFH